MKSHKPHTKPALASEPEIPGTIQTAVHATPEVAFGRFVNVVAFVQMEDAVVLDFLFQMGANVHLVSRVAMTKQVAQRLRDLLIRSLDQKESGGLFEPPPSLASRPSSAVEFPTRKRAKKVRND